MYDRPMEVCAALGLLVSELSDDPWRGRMVTFSRRPKLHRITGETLFEKTRFIQSMAWGTNIDFQAVFNKILEVAVGARLAPERMGSRVKDNLNKDRVMFASPTHQHYEMPVSRPQLPLLLIF
uniref:DUF7788 domain-containing protein n=1 Tax=Zea mays TaxID=4577 RepID=A0A804U6D2_MAIZE